MLGFELHVNIESWIQKRSAEFVKQVDKIVMLVQHSIEHVSSEYTYCVMHWSM